MTTDTRSDVAVVSLAHTPTQATHLERCTQVLELLADVGRLVWQGTHRGGRYGGWDDGCGFVYRHGCMYAWTSVARATRQDVGRVGTRESEPVSEPVSQSVSQPASQSVS